MRRRQLLSALALLPVPLWAQTLPPPAHGVPGRVRIAGTPGMAAVATAWARAFEVRHPHIETSLAMRGSDIAMAGLYTATADVALIGRPATKPEIQAFEWVYRFRPTSVPVLRGSVATPGRSPAIAVMVHRDNPLASLRIEQLAAAFGDDGARARHWSDLGLEGAWRDLPVNLYAPDAESGTGRFFRAAVLGDSNRMAWPRLHEFPVPPRPESAEAAAAAAMRRALAKDRAGLAVGVWGGDAAVRAVPLIGADGAAHMLDAASVQSGAYPLARDVLACFAAAPTRAPHAGPLAFLRFILSDEGQAIAAAARDYLPLPAGTAQEASAALG